MRDYEKTYERFWKTLVENADGSIDMDKLKRELHDYKTLLDNVPEVYCHITNNRISKPNTLASVVIAVADDCTNESFKQWKQEELEETNDIENRQGVDFSRDAE